MKTVCILADKVVMMQEGDALESMQANAAQIPGAVASLVTDAAYAALMMPTSVESKAASIESVKKLRRTSLDKFVKNSPGISRIYSENYYAATEFQAGRVTSLMVNGAEVQAYLTTLGARLGITATQFAAYIINENRGTVGLAIKASEIEDEYLRLAYTAMPAMTSEQAEQAVIDYAAFCNARKP